MTVAAVAGALQAAYEGGLVTYPRTDVRELSAESLGSVARLAFGAGLAQQELPSPGVLGNHEAVTPTAVMIPGLSDGVASSSLSAVDYLVAELGRQWLRVVSRWDIERPAISADAPAWVHDVAWSRPVPEMPRVLRRSIEADYVEPVHVGYESDEIALRVMVTAGLGRPSSLASHAERFADGAWIDRNGLTARGLECLDAAPVPLRTPDAAKQIEELIAATANEPAEAGPPLDVIERVLEAFPTLTLSLRDALGGEGEGGGIQETDSAVAFPITSDDDGAARRRDRLRRQRRGTHPEQEEGDVLTEMTVPSTSNELQDPSASANRKDYVAFSFDPSP